MRALLDLVLPVECGGCGAPATRWCPRCASEVSSEPQRLRPRVDPGVPCWTLGPYAGPRRRAVIAAKERGRHDLAAPLGNALAAALERLREHGELDLPQLAPLVLVPAPTRARAARVRGGDPVTRAARAASTVVARSSVAEMLQAQRGVRDSVGLSARRRQDNLAGRIALRPRVIAADANVVLVDDVLTTGATARESVGVLARAGVRVDAVLVICAA